MYEHLVPHAPGWESAPSRHPDTSCPGCGAPGTAFHAGAWNEYVLLFDGCEDKRRGEWERTTKIKSTMNAFVYERYGPPDGLALTNAPVPWALEWRGCVIAPERSMLNAVVATPNGGFLVTHMMPKWGGAFGQFAELLKANVLGIEGGYVLAWQSDKGFQRLANSEGAVANGIAITPDGETVFVNYSMTGELRRINRHTGIVEASNPSLPPLDNVTWTPDGQLLVAGGLADSFLEMLAMMSCSNLEAGTCPGAFAILAVDPMTLESETIYEGGPSTPSGAGTVGLRVRDGSLLIGTFAGDRIVRVWP